MTWNNFVVEYHNGSTWQTLSNVIEISSTIGRRIANDPWKPSTTSIVARYPSGFANPINALKIGAWIRWRSPNNLTGDASWTGLIRDVSVDWGIPYANNVGAADIITIDCEGHLGEWGRAQGNGLSMTAGFVNGSINFVASNLGLEWNGDVTDQPVGASVVTGSALDWLNLAAATAQARVIDGRPKSDTKEPSIYVGLSTLPFVLNVKFSDTTNNATNRRYDRIAYKSLADNYYTQVVVKADSLADQSATVGSGPYRTLTVETIAGSTNQMNDIADFVLASVDEQVVSISEISASSEGQHTNNLDTLGFGPFYWLPLCRVEVLFRGQTYYARIEGATMTANPEGARFTYYLTPQEFFAFLRLDDAVFGKLDENKLALY